MKLGELCKVIANSFVFDLSDFRSTFGTTDILGCLNVKYNSSDVGALKPVEYFACRRR